MSIDLHTLAGAYALDALSVDEAEEFAKHLELCAACRDEVRELREAAARMGEIEAATPPPALRARVLAAADQLPQLPPKVSSLQAARTRRRWAQGLVAAAAVVLVVGGGVVAVDRMNDDDGTSQVAADAVSKVFSAPDAHQETVSTSNGGRLTIATSRQFGQMAVKTSGLPTPDGSRVYQLWTIHNGAATPAGVVKDLAAGRVLAMPATGTTVAITVEPQGGSETPTTKPIVELDPEEV